MPRACSIFVRTAARSDKLKTGFTFGLYSIIRLIELDYIFLLYNSIKQTNCICNWHFRVEFNTLFM